MLINSLEFSDCGDLEWYSSGAELSWADFVHLPSTLPKGLSFIKKSSVLRNSHSAICESSTLSLIVSASWLGMMDLVTHCWTLCCIPEKPPHSRPLFIRPVVLQLGYILDLYALSDVWIWNTFLDSLAYMYTLEFILLCESFLTLWNLIFIFLLFLCLLVHVTIFLSQTDVMTFSLLFSTV